jgi:hypothetical protein
MNTAKLSFIDPITFYDGIRNMNPITATGKAFVDSTLTKLKTSPLTHNAINSIVTESALLDHDINVAAWHANMSAQITNNFMSFKVAFINESLSSQSSNIATNAQSLLYKLSELTNDEMITKVANGYLDAYAVYPEIALLISYAKNQYFKSNKPHENIITPTNPIGCIIKYEDGLIICFDGYSFIKAESTDSAYTHVSMEKVSSFTDQPINFIAQALTKIIYDVHKQCFDVKLPIGTVTLNELGLALDGKQIDRNVLQQVFADYFKLQSTTIDKSPIYDADSKLSALLTIFEHFNSIILVDNVINCSPVTQPINGIGVLHQYIAAFDDKYQTIIVDAKFSGIENVVVTDFKYASKAIAALPHDIYSTALRQIFADNIATEAQLIAAHNTQIASINAQLVDVNNTIADIKAAKLKTKSPEAIEKLDSALSNMVAQQNKLLILLSI